LAFAAPPIIKPEVYLENAPIPACRVSGHFCRIAVKVSKNKRHTIHKIHTAAQESGKLVSKKQGGSHANQMLILRNPVFHEQGRNF
jgi:hypothetical protein